MRIFPFQPLVPSSDDAANTITCPHFDAYSTEHVRQLLQSNPDSFMSVLRPDALDTNRRRSISARPSQHVPSVTSSSSSNCNSSSQRSKSSLHRLVKNRLLIRDVTPSFYIYQLHTVSTGHVQTGLVCTVRVSDYDNGRILKHELTRPEKEAACTKTINELSANIGGPVLLTYRDVPSINDIMDAIVQACDPMLHIGHESTHDGVEHTIFRVPDHFVMVLNSAFHRGVQKAYIADGHHRAATTSNVAALRGKSRTAKFCAAFFPQSHMQLLSFSRVVTGTMDSAVSNILRHVSNNVQGARIVPLGQDEQFNNDLPSHVPERQGDVHMYVNGKWYLVSLPSPKQQKSIASRLDPAVLHNAVIKHVAKEKDLYYVSGAVDAMSLSEQVDELATRKGSACAFMLRSVTVDDVMQVADANEIMPAKSTSFEPKLRCGFFVHTF